MKCETHDKHSVLWWDPCVDKRVPNFFQRIDTIAWLIGVESTISSFGRVQVTQTKEKYGCTEIYYSSSSSCDLVEDIPANIRKNGKKRLYKTPKYMWRAMERQRRLNPHLAHYIYNIPYDCNCKDDFWCKLYAPINPLQKLWDSIITKLLEFYGNHSTRWGMLNGGFVVYGRQWGPRSWQKAKRSLRKPL